MIKKFILALLLLVSSDVYGQIFDSNIILANALEGTSAPKEIAQKLAIVDVDYYSTDSLLHRGQIVIDSALVDDIKKVFSLACKIKYPIDMVIPVKFDLPQDGTTMSNLNNTYSFHYRNKIGQTNNLSMHSYGRAIDFNPFNNPFISTSGKVIPVGAIRNLDDKRTLTKEHPIVVKFISLGWIWGGNWINTKDYMHFEKPL